MTPIIVIKFDHLGHEVFRYQGKQLQRDAEKVVLEAFFGFERVQAGSLVILKGDRFIETFYARRWYNTFEVHNREDDSLKGYYCNVGYPAELLEGQVSYRDLALDLVVMPDGRQQVLDKDEFEALPIEDDVRQQALEGLKQLQGLFKDTR
jgi:predicted RNA-binding protein associated with RNAse of E/G family